MYLQGRNIFQKILGYLESSGLSWGEGNELEVQAGACCSVPRAEPRDGVSLCPVLVPLPREGWLWGWPHAKRNNPDGWEVE